jgi:hypothetical protein
LIVVGTLPPARGFHHIATKRLSGCKGRSIIDGRA